MEGKIYSPFGKFAEQAKKINASKIHSLFGNLAQWAK